MSLNMKKSRWRHLKNKWVLTAIAIVVIISVFVWYRRGNTAPTFEWTAAEVGNVIETVSVTGTVSPVGKASLSFEKGGVRFAQ